MGRGVVEESEVKVFLKWYHDYERYSQTAAYNGESYTATPSAEAAAADFIEKRFHRGAGLPHAVQAGNVLTDMINGSAGGGSASSSSGCYAKGHQLYGNVKVVDYGADITVKVVSYGADLNVKKVDYGATSCGLWKFVDYGADFTVKFVDYGADIEVKFVDYGAGLG